MDNSEWSNQETAVIVYFASRHVDHLGCSRILVRKTGGTLLMPRTAFDVEMRLNEVMWTHDLYNSNLRWDCLKVDAWLAAMGLCNLRALVEVRMEELQIVAPVRSSLIYESPMLFQFFSLICARRSAKCSSIPC